MIIKEIKKDWYIVKTENLAFFGRSKGEVMSRALHYITGMKGTANA